MWLIDTNVFLRVLVREDEGAFEESKMILEQIKRGKVKAMTGGIVLAELAWVLSSFYGLGRGEISEKLNGVRLLPGLKIMDEYDYEWAIGQYQKGKVKFIDSVLASMPGVRDRTVTVISYDGDFEKLDCRWKLPGEV